jgi:hypothetical protein
LKRVKQVFERHLGLERPCTCEQVGGVHPSSRAGRVE